MKSRLFSFLFSAFLLIIFVGITFLGCADNLDNSIVTAPTDNLDNSIVTTPNNSQLMEQQPPASENFTTFSVSKLIDG
ncbi:MAG: hypothetical protein O6940_14235, partial [Ignavibacteria bacterium]|nr:hypothetical protein [Ignavibacteria bacterium]